MFTLPYRTLIQQKRWATNGLHAVIAENLQRIPDDDQVLIRRLLDHIQAVDEIFSHNLEGQPHGHQAPRSAELPSLEALRAAGPARRRIGMPTMPMHCSSRRSTSPVAFSFSNGEPARMSARRDAAARRHACRRPSRPGRSSAAEERHRPLAGSDHGLPQSGR